MTGSFEQLAAEHRAIAIACDRLVAALKRTPRVGQEELARLRSTVSGLLMAHVQAEGEHVLGPLAALSGSAGPAADAVLRDVRDARAAYSDHVRRWSQRAIADDWDGYVKAVTAMVATVRRLAQREEHDLYRPALALIERARARDAA